MREPIDEVPRPTVRPPRRPPPRHEEEVWIFSGTVDERPRRRPAPAGGGAAASRRPAATPRPQPDAGRGPAAARRLPAEPELPADVRAELTDVVGQQRGTKLAERMAAAARAYERDRYQDAVRITRLIVDQVPESAAARELHGLTCYRLGRWREAIRHLEAARSLAGDDPSQLPVLMDCHRAQGHHRRVEELWDELRGASPDADVLAEGRLVRASALAERGDLQAALELLTGAGAAKALRHPAERHVRQWYVLADLFERAGDLPRARELFARVVDADPELADASTRLAGLGRARSRRPAPRREPSSGSRRAAGAPTARR